MMILDSLDPFWSRERAVTCGFVDRRPARSGSIRTATARFPSKSLSFFGASTTMEVYLEDRQSTLFSPVLVRPRPC